MRKAERDKLLAQSNYDKYISKKDMWGRLESTNNTNKYEYHRPAGGYYKSRTTSEFAPKEPPIKDVVDQLVTEVAKLTVQVDTLKEEVTSHEQVQSEFWKLIEALKMRVEQLEQDLDVQIDGVHTEIKDIWEELTE